MSRLVFLFWFISNRLLNQVSTVVCTGWGRSHASSMLLSKIVLLVTEIQDLNPGCWSRKAGMLNSPDQMISAACCCFNRLMLQTIYLHQLMGNWFHIYWKYIISKALFRKGTKAGIKSLELRYLNVHTLSHVLCLQDLIQAFVHLLLDHKWSLQYC